MKNELRLGNWIESDNTEYDSKKKELVTSRVQFQINESQMRNIFNTYKTEFDFIQLTEQWLKDFGFEVNGRYIYQIELPKGRFLERMLWNKKTSIFAVSCKDKYEYEIARILYIHTLQNLYFALTGKELTKDDNTNKTNG